MFFIESICDDPKIVETNIKVCVRYEQRVICDLVVNWQVMLCVFSLIKIMRGASVVAVAN